MNEKDKNKAEIIISIMKRDDFNGTVEARDITTKEVGIGYSDARRILFSLRDNYQLIDFDNNIDRYSLKTGGWNFKSFQHLENEEKRISEREESIKNKTLESFKYGKWGFWISIIAIIISLITLIWK